MFARLLRLSIFKRLKRLIIIKIYIIILKDSSHPNEGMINIVNFKDSSHPNEGIINIKTKNASFLLFVPVLHSNLFVYFNFITFFLFSVIF